MHFMGYPPNQKGYLLYHVKMKNLFVTRHVTFLENKFLFRDKYFSHHNSFAPFTVNDPFLYENDSPLVVEDHHSPQHPLMHSHQPLAYPELHEPGPIQSNSSAHQEEEGNPTQVDTKNTLQPPPG